MEKKKTTISPQEILNARFHWIGNTYTKPAKSESDISINKVKWTGAKNDDGKQKAYSFIFRNKVWEKIGENVQIAIDEDKILFRSVDASVAGMRLNGKKDGKGNDCSVNKYGRLKETEDTIELSNFIGDYNLLFNDFFGIYYIQKTKGE